jgi:hypothetical protein
MEDQAGNVASAMDALGRASWLLAEARNGRPFRMGRLTAATAAEGLNDSPQNRKQL